MDLKDLNVVLSPLEERFKEPGTIFSRVAKRFSFVLTDRELVNGQNPSASKPGAEELPKLLHSF